MNARGRVPPLRPTPVSRFRAAARSRKPPLAAVFICALLNVISIHDASAADPLPSEVEPYNYADATLLPGVTPIRLAHFTEPRVALDQYFDCRSLPRPAYPLPAPGAGLPVLGRHLTEIRTNVSTAK